MKHVVSLLCYIYSLQLSAQTITLHTDKQVMEIHTERSLTPIPLFKLKGDSMQTNKLNESGPFVHIQKLPIMKGCLDTGYTWMYLKETKNAQMPNHVPLLIGNSNNLYPALVFIDYNLNLDFSDDGPPIEVKWRTSGARVSMKHPADSNLFIAFQLNRFNWSSDATNYRLMMQDYFKKQYPDRVFLGVDACLRIQQYNCRTSTVYSPYDTFTVALFDANGNGRFNDAGKDMVIFCATDSAPNKDGGAAPVVVLNKEKARMPMVWKGLTYQVGWPDVFGSTLAMEFPKDTNRLALLVKAGDKLPKFRFRDPMSDRRWIKLSHYRWKKVYLYFWDINAPSFAADTAALHIMNEKYGRRIKIITLNYSAHPEMLKNQISFKRLNWVHGYANETLMKTLGITKLPVGFYLGRFRKIKKAPISPTELLYLLEH